MVSLAAVIVAVLLALSALHLYWALGGRWAHAAVVPELGGQPSFRPGTAATVLVAGLLAIAGVIVLGRVGLGPAADSPLLTRVGAWLVAAAFLLRAVGDFRLIGLFRRVGDTRFAWWDRHLYTPLSLMVGLGTAIIAAGTA